VTPRRRSCSFGGTSKASQPPPWLGRLFSLLHKGPIQLFVARIFVGENCWLSVLSSA
jgi:hypothetical protein